MRDLYQLRERAEPVLRIACLIMAGIVVYQFAGMILRWNPFHGVTVPALPTLTAATNNPTAGSSAIKPIAPKLGTEKAAASLPAHTNTMAATNASALPTGTNTEPMNQGTNLPGSTTATGTNISSGSKHPEKTNAAALFGLSAMRSAQPSGMRGNDLPPAVQARISRVVDSEILGPVMRPLPMGLMGIAGDVAFLRSASGQTGLVKEGGSLDDIKLLRIGINRVLIEQGGQQKELTIFSGYGSESLLPKEDTNENHHP